VTLVILFWTTLALGCVFVAWAGDRDEKICIGSYAIASILSALVISPLSTRMRHVEWPMFGVDAVLFLVFLAFVVRSRRYWPLWTTGLQVVSLVTNSVVLGPATPRAYAMTLGILAYAILGSIFVGAFRSRRARGARARERASEATAPAYAAPGGLRP
jgi:hypothetical protein